MGTEQDISAAADQLLLRLRLYKSEAGYRVFLEDTGNMDVHRMVCIIEKELARDGLLSCSETGYRPVHFRIAEEKEGCLTGSCKIHGLRSVRFMIGSEKQVTGSLG